MDAGKTIAVDVDDVLVHISTPWVRRALAHPTLSPWLSALQADDLARQVTTRLHPYIQPWLCSLGLPEVHVPLLDSLYRDDEAFYDDLPPTAMCVALARALELPRVMAHVHVVTHCFGLDEPATRSKVRWLQRHLGEEGGRLTFHLLTPGEKKSEVLRQFCPEPDSFADDAMKNVLDVLLNDAVRPAEILIPRMGHNELHPKVEALARLRRIRLSHYAEAA